MNKASRFLTLIFLVTFMLSLTSCTTKTENKELTRENFSSMLEINTETTSELSFFGVWHIDKLALQSRYINETGSEPPEWDEEDYIGYEIEYTSEFLRLGEDKFYEPEYILNYIKASDYNETGNFRLTYPNLFEFIENEEIQVDEMEEYENIEDLPLAYYEVEFKEENFIPVGMQYILLNKDTMLIGIIGKVLLAHRVEE